MKKLIFASMLLLAALASASAFADGTILVVPLNQPHQLPNPNLGRNKQSPVVSPVVSGFEAGMRIRKQRAEIAKMKADTQLENLKIQQLQQQIQLKNLQIQQAQREAAQTNKQAADKAAHNATNTPPPTE